MTSRTGTVSVIVFALVCLHLQTAHADAADEMPLAATDEAFLSDVLPLVRKYCVDCHGAEEPDGDVSLQGLRRPEQVLEDRDTWVRAIRLLGIDAMPPKDHSNRMNAGERRKFVEWLDLKLFHVDCNLAHDAGRVTIHRLNRVEYTNTVRDLLGVDIDPARDFPSDDVGYGFSNIADVLSLPPLLFEKYVEASEKIAAATIMTTESGRPTQRFKASQLEISGAAQLRGDWIAMPSRGSAVRRHEITVPGKYVVRVEAMADQAGPEAARMEISVDGRRVVIHDISGHREPAMYEFRQDLDQGPRRIEAAFINDYYKPDAENPRDRDRNLSVRFIEITGPVDGPPPEPHRRVVFVTSGPGKSVAQAAREVFGRLLPRAFRRPVDGVEIERFVRIVEFAVGRGDSFERGVQAGLQAALISPHFLFRIEYDDVPRDTGAEHSVSSYELASRLSYFLWSTMPDAELLNVAAEGRLHEPGVLNAQIDRMLVDPKADALVTNFASQWLTLSNMVEAEPNRQLFPEFTSELRADMVKETQLFAGYIFRQNRSLLEFLDADYTFVNERLANHYGIDGVRGDEFQQVSLPNGTRTGVLTHGSLLTITSNPDRTSLVRRGVWILDNILGTELPAPPANVPSLEEGAKESGATSLRDQLKIHREMPACAACHDILDPLGFGFENFDPIGRWRETAEGKPVDAGGTLPGGESFSGPVELAKILKKRRVEFAELVTRKMLTYALGRGLEIPDSCAVEEIVSKLREDDYRFRTLVREIVHSKPFLVRRQETSLVSDNDILKEVEE